MHPWKTIGQTSVGNALKDACGKEAGGHLAGICKCVSSSSSLADVLWSNEVVMFAARELFPVQQKCKLTFCKNPAVHQWETTTAIAERTLA